ncbi:MAG TPA: response regulator transcription factor [Puia sp.]|jgi:two-component system nitrate/nitrite response regulator NarL|nr:response regulator transcription factor [Puia sp.]
MENYILPINLLIADDHQLFIDGLTKILENEKIIGEIFAVNNGKEVSETISLQSIDCIIMDINMPVMNGLETTKQVKLSNPEIKIIVVSMQCDVSIVSKMLKAGADGFINKDTGKDELLTAINKVMGNEKYISPAISRNLFSFFSEKKNISSENEKQLTARELEIIKLIADGLTNQEIAAKLFLSTMTVDTHRKNMIAKLQLKNTASLVKYAFEHKLL